MRESVWKKRRLEASCVIYRGRYTFKINNGPPERKEDGLRQSSGAAATITIIPDFRYIGTFRKCFSKSPDRSLKSDR